MPRWLCGLNLPWIGGHLWSSDEETERVHCTRCKRWLW